MCLSSNLLIFSGWTVFGDIHKKEKCFTKKYGDVLAKKCHSMSVYKICKTMHLDDVSS